MVAFKFYPRATPGDPPVIALTDFIEPGDASVSVVGESRYQDNFERIFGPRGERWPVRNCDADLICEDTNPHDDQAVRVVISGLTVGYLSKRDARRYRKKYGNVNSSCEAEVRGGWDRGPGDRGNFGVKLDLPLQPGD